MSSSSSPSSSQTGGEGGGDGGDRGMRRRRGRHRHRRHQVLLRGENSSSAVSVAAAAVSTSSSSRRPRSSSSSSSSIVAAARDGVWPEPFLEALAVQVSLDASFSVGRLAAAPAVVIIFQVCPTWAAVSRSELLWQNLTRRVWNRTRRLHETWRDHYIDLHRTARNFRDRRYIHTTLHDNNGNGADNNLICFRIALSDLHLAAGFSDGSVRLFDLRSFLQLHTFRPFIRDRLGLYSCAVAGIILYPQRLTFASLDGDVHVVSHFDFAGPVAIPPTRTRRAHVGDVVNDGVLVDFTGCERFWIGLYAGVPGRSIHIWDAESEELRFGGGTLTDPEAVMGWHMLTEWTTEFVGRVRVTGRELAVACTSSRVLVIDLKVLEGLVLWEEETPQGAMIVGVVDAADGAFMTADARGVVSVRRARMLGEVCRFGLRGASAAGVVLGCMNSGYAVACVGGVVRAWEIEHGEHLYSFRERVGEVSALAANDRHVAGASDGRTIHVWDFGA